MFLNFSNEFTSQCVHPYLNPRTEQDLISDLEKTFSNWYRLKKGEDVADVCGHICMRLGRCDKALKFLQVFFTDTQFSRAVHPLFRAALFS